MTSASNAFLVDTNVLVYLCDPRDQTKLERALLVVRSLRTTGQGVLSVQCLMEFFSVATRRLPERLRPREAQAWVERLGQAFPILDLTLPVVLEGCRGAVEHQLSFWDALIWGVAKLNQIPCVLTEDAPHGRVLEGVRFLNPFAPDFDLALLGAS